jgi:polysaccharide chain length determinant protein (PEP-CTERM system associated)
MIGQRELNFDDYVAILRRRWWIVLSCAAFGLVAAFALCRLLPKSYTSKTLVLITPPTVTANYIQPVITGTMDERLASMQEQILSRTRLQPVVKEFGLYSEDRADSVPLESRVNRLRKAIKVEPIQPTPGTRSVDLPGFTVAVTLGTPLLAQQVCARVTSLFMEQNLRVRQNQAEDTTQFLAGQLNDAKVKLDERDSELAAFTRRYTGALAEDGTTNLNLLTSATQQLDVTTQALNRAQQDKAFAQTMLAQQLDAWRASQSNHNPAALTKQLNDLQSQLVTLRARYTDDYPDVIKTKNDIAQLEKRIREADSNAPKDDANLATKSSSVEPLQIQQLRAQIHQDTVTIQQATSQQQQLQRQIETLQARVQSSPSVQEEYKQLSQERQTALDFYDSLLKKQKDSAMATDLARRQQSEQFRVLDPANLPDRPSFPDPFRFYPGGLAGGLALGLGLVVLLEARDKTIRTERDVRYFLELPTLALIPGIDVGRSSLPGNGKSKILPTAGAGLPSIRS